MAKIGKLNLRIKGNLHEFQINVNSKGIFYTKLPDDLVLFNDEQEKLEARTKDSLEDAIKNIVNAYNAAETTSEKVIVIVIDVSEDFYIGNRGIFSPQEVGARAGVFEKKTTGASSSYEWLPNNFPGHLRLTRFDDSSRYKRVIEIGWTADIELGVLDMLIQFHALCAMYADLEAVSAIVHGEESMVNVFNRFYALADEEYSKDEEEE